MARQTEPTFSAEDRAKAAILNHLLASKRISRGGILASEFVLGKSGVRADLAVFGKSLIGIEVKTDKDNLRRLPTQLPAYRQHCHRTILAIAPKHLTGVKMAGQDDMEVWLLLDDGSVRELTTNTFNAADVDISSLLTQEEVKRLHRLVHLSPKVDETQLALGILGNRYKASSNQFWNEVGRRRIRATDIEALSRFRSQRAVWAEWKASQQDSWRSWQEGAERFFSTA